MSDIKEKMAASFLRLRDFEEYLVRLEEFIGLTKDPDKACCMNVEHAVSRLKQEFADHPEVGTAEIEGAVYDIRSGHVCWL